eukprot:7732666-Pyramimonas_sp.AAC.1
MPDRILPRGHAWRRAPMPPRRSAWNTRAALETRAEATAPPRRSAAPLPRRSRDARRGHL